ncbi:MAG: T9SS type A sorting domain-containing protein [Bacteroidales bacterium]|nr:T9SS type A sorting domain-containing protein [Bacteroidales bacterium]
MKKLFILVFSLATLISMQAQWVDNPATNTFIVNSSADAGEVYLSTDEVSGDTYLQFNQMRSNGWVPTLQRLTFEGIPQWGDDGITITGQTCSTWSQGVAMAATNDDGVVSCFSNEAGHCVAVKINADGSFPWGEQGITLFGGQGGSRTELLAGIDKGVWALGADYDNTYLQYVNADGTLGPTTTIGDGEHQYMFGLMVPSVDDRVLVVFEKEDWAYTYYYEKSIYVACYTREGEQIGNETLLMLPQIIGGSYCHYVVPDGEGGGYAYIWHPAIGGAFNIYVFHFDENGISTISDLNGIPVHSTDPSNYYTGAYGTVDPVSHDLIIAYEQTDSYSQSESRIYMNRITATGDKLWDEGILVADNIGDSYSDILVDAFEDGSGFSLIYNKGSYNSTVEAKGFDMNGNLMWTKQMSSNSYARAMCDNSAGFHMGQNVVAWVNSSNGNVYGQNIGPDGTMGPIEPPVITCLAPENFAGEYVYDDETQTFGALLTWTAPETQPLHYNLTRMDLSNFIVTGIEVPGDAVSYYDEVELGNYWYQLTAVYENCESDYALTPDGEYHVYIEVTGLEENSNDVIVNVLNVFNMKGQRITVNDMDELSTGVYILQGLTEDGRLVSRKVMVNKK